MYILKIHFVLYSVSLIMSDINSTFKYFVNLVHVHIVISHLCICNLTLSRKIDSDTSLNNSQNLPLMAFSDFTSEASLFKRGRCNERRNEKQLRLLSRDRTQRLSTLNAHGRTCGAAPLRESRERH